MEKKDVIHFTIDGMSVTAEKGTTVYAAARRLGIDIPIFCYHDRMPPFGACRVCLVEVENSGKPQTSCTLEATEGMIVKTQSKLAEEGRKGILELLLINHPLDCPICDRGGECPLQDQTLKFGPGESRFFEEKRHFSKAKPLGPLLMLDRERCIICARCTRFGDIVAGDHALELIERGYRSEVGTFGDEPVKSKFIGNTIMICPVGALTSQVYRFRARPWDNESTGSTCTLCPVGCSMILDSRDGEIVRTRSLENRYVNDIWLCDKGWFGYEFESHPERLKHPMIRRGGKLEKASWEEAISLISETISRVKPEGRLAGFGGNPLTTEENYLFQKLMRKGAGVHHVDSQINELFSLEDGYFPGMEISFEECEMLTGALLFGFDLTEEFPLLWLRLKQAIDRGAKVSFYGHYAPEVSRYFSEVLLHTPGEEMNALKKAFEVLEMSYNSNRPIAIFLGSQYLNHPNRQQILQEVTLWQKKFPSLKINIMQGSGNSMGSQFAGMNPYFLPGFESLDRPGLKAFQVIEQSAKEGWDFLYVAGANPAKKFPAKLWIEARAKLGFLVVQDLFLTETARQAEVVLPALNYTEKKGTFINIEGRVQKLEIGKKIPSDLLSDGEIFEKIAEKMSLTLDVDELFLELLQSSHIPLQRRDNPSVFSEETRRSQGNLFATFSHSLFDEGVRMKHNAHLIQMVKEPVIRIHPIEGVKRQIGDGHFAQVRSPHGALSAKVHLDERVALETVVLPLGFDKLPIHELGINLRNGMAIELSKE